MADLVPADQIEQIVGARRHATAHLARASSANQTLYVLHSQACKESGIDLRDCAYSIALDRGIDVEAWEQDRTCPVAIAQGTGRLVPVEAPAELA